MNNNMSRHEFIRLGILAAAGICLAGCDLFLAPGDHPVEPETGKRPETGPPDRNGEKKADEKWPIPRRVLGRTGFPVSTFALGGAFAVAGGRLQEEAEAIINRALDLGVNYIDTAPTYGGSESNIGAVMSRRRHEAYLAGKTLDRTYDGTMRLFEQSLKDLQTDYLDLYQLHGVHTDADLQQVMGPAGAYRALQELKKGGAVKATGITSHKNYHVLLDALKEFAFDCLLLALNPGEAAAEPLLDDVIREAVQKEIGIIAMKVAAYGRIFRQGGVESMEQALGYALSYPVSASVIGISTMAELEENVRLAGNFQPFTPAQMSHLEDLAKPYRQEITFYKQW